MLRFVVPVFENMKQMINVTATLVVTTNQLGFNNNCYDKVCRNSCFNEAGPNSCYDKAGHNSSKTRLKNPDQLLCVETNPDTNSKMVRCRTIEILTNKILLTKVIDK